jgi:hypothetical protein
VSSTRTNDERLRAPVEDFLDPDDPTLFPRLAPEQVEYLAEIGTQLSFALSPERERRDSNPRPPA